MSLDVPRYEHGSRVPGWDEAADLTKAPAGVPDPAVCDVPADLRAEIEAYMERYPDTRSAAIPALKAVQERYGWCSPEAIEQVACVMRLTPGYLVAVAGFYDQLETRPVGRRPVYVCTNISCSLRGADELLASLQHELAGDDDINLRGFECLGACDIAPDGVRRRRLRRPCRRGRDPGAGPADPRRRGSPARQADHPPSLPGPQRGPGLTPKAPMTPSILFKNIDEPGLATLDVYRARGGYGDRLRKALSMPREALVEELKASGLRGRGGAGFSMGTKASFMPKGQMDKYLVCNADESEPGTFKDRELMQKSPHMLIEGMIIAAYAAGANRSFIYIRGEYEQQADILEAAIVEAKDAGLIGDRILGFDVDLSLWVHRGAGAYICGEETALLDSLEGKRGNPRLKPPFPANQGLYQGPTLINNVETLATLPHIIEMGADAYAAIGVQNSTGTKLISVSGHVQKPGNYEIELGMSSRDIIYGLAGGPGEGRTVKMWFPGGSSSPVLTGDDLDLSLRLRHARQGRHDARVRRDHRRGRPDVGRRRRAEDRAVLPSRVVRQVHTLPRGDELDGEDARAHQDRRGDPDGPGPHGQRLREHHRQLPLRPR